MAGLGFIQQSRDCMNRSNGAVLKCIGSDPRRAHGLASGLVLADEPVAVGGIQERGHGCGIEDGPRKIRARAAYWHWAHNPPIVAIGSPRCCTAAATTPSCTQPVKMILHFSVGRGKSANPSLDIMPDLEKQIRRDAAMAKLDESQLPSIPGTTVEPWEPVGRSPVRAH